MDGFYAFVIWTVVTCGLAFTAGKYLPQAELSKDCSSKGEMVISNKVYKCEPVAVWVDGKRIPLETQ